MWRAKGERNKRAYNKFVISNKNEGMQFEKAERLKFSILSQLMTKKECEIFKRFIPVHMVDAAVTKRMISNEKGRQCQNM